MTRLASLVKNGRTYTADYYVSRGVVCLHVSWISSDGAWKSGDIGTASMPEGLRPAMPISVTTCKINNQQPIRVVVGSDGKVIWSQPGGAQTGDAFYCLVTYPVA